MIGDATFRVGDAFALAAELAATGEKYDLVVSSPPFLALRSYLPADHPLKAQEMGSETTPAEYLDSLLALVARLAESLAPYGSLVFELGDTYAGSGGAGGDYNEGGMRDLQPRFPGSGSKHRMESAKAGTNSRLAAGSGWPPEKSLTGIPTLFAWSLAYGRNLLTGEASPAGQWRIRNLIPWARPNPPVGALGDKWRPATSYVVVATKARDRWFDLDAVRREFNPETGRTVGQPAKGPAGGPGMNCGVPRASGPTKPNPAGAPPLDWFVDEQYADQPEPKWSIDDGLWVINTRGYKGAHYATWPEELVRRLVLSMCPREVCRECGEPRRRVTGAASYVPSASYRGGVMRDGAERVAEGANQWKANGHGEASVVRSAQTLGWTHCACGDGCRPTTWRVDAVEVEQIKVDGQWQDADPGDEPDEDVPRRIRRKRKRVVDDLGECADPGHWRRGRVLDPFVGSGTSLLVAIRNGRDALGFDLDESNVALARERLARLPLTVEGAEPEPEWAEGSLFRLAEL